ncbi:hypothetical protein ACFV0Y_03770 [Streptomyces sp. NPDC059569]|uniref:hypothetical protein n=1 Tax=Streptomyces sp. NPDC059569 TaxID=3346869 RepID=UPI003673EC21
MSSRTSCCPAGVTKDFETCAIRAAWSTAGVLSAALANVVAMVVTSWERVDTVLVLAYLAPRPASATSG